MTQINIKELEVVLKHRVEDGWVCPDVVLEAAKAYAVQQWQDISTAPRDGAFLAWCRWYMVPTYKSGMSTQPEPYWTNWMTRHCWMGHNNLPQGEGNALYHAHSVEATHWQPLPPAPVKEGE